MKKRSFEGSLDCVFDADALSPDPARHPAAALAAGWEGTVGPGDLLFVPADCPHFVFNLSDTAALSANFVDGSNLARCLAACAALGPQGAALGAALADLARAEAEAEAAAEVTAEANEEEEPAAQAEAATQ